MKFQQNAKIFSTKSIHLILMTGDTFAMYIHRQQCTIMIYVPANDLINSTEEPEDAIVATFPGSLHPRDIYEHESDLEVIYHVHYRNK